MIDHAVLPDFSPTPHTVGSSPPRRQAEPGSAGDDARLSRERSLAHMQRCSRLPPVSSGEAESLIAQFLAKRGGVTQCPPAYLAPVR